MQDLIKESASELERDFIYKNMGYEPNGYSIVIDKKDDCPISMEQILDWHTKQMEKAYNKGREETIKIIQEELNRFRQGEIGDLIASLPYIVDRETGNLKILKV